MRPLHPPSVPFIVIAPIPPYRPAFPLLPCAILTSIVWKILQTNWTAGMMHRLNIQVRSIAKHHVGRVIHSSV